MRTRNVVSPVYRPAPPGITFTGIDPILGAPLRSYCYRDAQDFELMWVTEHAPRDDAPTASGAPPRRFWLWADPGRWSRHSEPPPSPIWYRLNDVLRSRGRVWVFSTEAECDALMNACPGEVATTWSGGDRRISNAVWGSLRGRSCYLWPSQDPMAAGRFLRAAESLAKAAEAVWMVPTDAFPTLPEKPDLQAIIASAAPILPGTPLKPPTTLQRSAESAAVRHKRWNMVMSPNGLPYGNADNAVRFLEALETEGLPDAPLLWFDDLECRMKGRWGTVDKEVDDADMIRILRLAQGPYGGMPHLARSVLEDAALLVAMGKRRNPYRDWFASLKWDGQKRIDSAFKRAWKVAENDYTTACSRIFFMQFAKRVLEPGCQADYMMVFEGKTGCGKTTSLETLFGLEFVDSPTHMWGDKDFYLGLLGKLCIEVAEFAGLSGRTLDIAKKDITRKVDRFRPPFGRKPIDFPRRCIFAGTTERDDWNKDEMLSMRRFMPVRCLGQIDRDLIRAEREQWFAEACARVRKGECTWDIPSAEAAREHLLRVADDAIDRAIATYLEHQKETNVGDILTVGLGLEDRAKWTPHMQQRIARSLRKLGWEPARGSGLRKWVRLTTSPLPSDPF
jgi:Virulence-associated protein E-like domain